MASLSWWRVPAAYLLAVSLTCTGLLPLTKAQPQSPPQAQAASETIYLDLVLLNGFLVFFMQAGFVATESGHGRAKNVRNILLKNTIDVMLCTVCWWAVGYAFAYGRSAGGFLGASEFFTSGDTAKGRKPWFFTWTFALSTITIPSGCLAERTHLFTYPVYTTLLSTFVHPLVAHWVWSGQGWLSKVSDTCQFLDFAGGAVVHLVGGLTGLVGAAVCGPRLGRFEEGGFKELPGHDMSSVALGTFMLWFGWFGFNCGSTYLYLGTITSSSLAVNRVAICMTLCASVSGMTTLAITSVRTGTFDLGMCCNGLLAGLSASTAVAGFIHPWAACCVGAVAGICYIVTTAGLKRVGVDDPLDSSTVHCGSGVLGCLATGILARPSQVQLLTRNDCGGIVYGRNGWLQLGLQVLGVSVVAAWTLAWAIPLFLLLKRFHLLRVDQQTELAGIDNIEHGGPAFPEFLNRQAAR